MTLERVIRRLEVEYERAKQLEYVRDPLAYALYTVWRSVDNERREMDLSAAAGSSWAQGLKAEPIPEITNAMKELAKEVTEKVRKELLK